MKIYTRDIMEERKGEGGGTLWVRCDQSWRRLLGITTRPFAEGWCVCVPGRNGHQMTPLTPRGGACARTQSRPFHYESVVTGGNICGQVTSWGSHQEPNRQGRDRVNWRCQGTIGMSACAKHTNRNQCGEWVARAVDCPA